MNVKIQRQVDSDSWRVYVAGKSLGYCYIDLSSDYLDNTSSRDVVAFIARSIEELTEKIQAYNHPLYQEMPAHEDV